MAHRRSKSSALAVQKGRRAPSDSEMDAAARAQGYTSLAAMQGAMARAEHDRLSHRSLRPIERAMAKADEHMERIGITRATASREMSGTLDIAYARSAPFRPGPGSFEVASSATGRMAPLGLGPRRLSTALTNTDAYLASLGKI